VSAILVKKNVNFTNMGRIERVVVNKN